MPDITEIPLGLSALFFPELGEPDEYNQVSPVSAEQTLQKANKFLADLNAVGVEIVAMVPVEVAKPDQPGVIGTITAARQLLIVKR